jgi:hypothetical protein
MDRTELRRSLVEVLAYLSASAHGALASSKLYGPLRLIEGCERLIRAMEEIGLADPELNKLADDIAAQGMLLSTDAERCRAFADHLTVVLAGKLKHASDEPNQDVVC